MADKKSIVIKLKYPVPGRQANKNASSPEMITDWNVKRIVLALGAIILIITLPLYFYFSSSPEDNSPKPSGLADQITSPEINPDAGSDSAKVPEAKAASPQSINVAAPESQVPNEQSGSVNAIAAQETTKTLESTGKKQTDIEAKEAEKIQPVIVKNRNDLTERKSRQVIRSLLAYKIINKEPVQIINSPVRVSKSKAVQVNYFTELKGMNNKTIYHEWIKKGKVVSRQRLKISADRWRTASSKLFNHTALGHWHVRTVDVKNRLLDKKEFNIILDR